MWNKKGALDRVDREKAVSFVLKCMNFDGGFGCIEGAESHAGQVSTRLKYTFMPIEKSKKKLKKKNNRFDT